MSWVGWLYLILSIVTIVRSTTISVIKIIPTLMYTILKKQLADTCLCSILTSHVMDKQWKGQTPKQETRRAPSTQTDTTVFCQWGCARWWHTGIDSAVLYIEWGLTGISQYHRALRVSHKTSRANWKASRTHLISTADNSKPMSPIVSNPEHYQMQRSMLLAGSKNHTMDLNINNYVLYIMIYTAVSCHLSNVCSYFWVHYKYPETDPFHNATMQLCTFLYLTFKTWRILIL